MLLLGVIDKTSRKRVSRLFSPSFGNCVPNEDTAKNERLNGWSDRRLTETEKMMWLLDGIGVAWSVIGSCPGGTVLKEGVDRFATYHWRRRKCVTEFHLD